MKVAKVLVGVDVCHHERIIIWLENIPQEIKDTWSESIKKTRWYNDPNAQLVINIAGNDFQNISDNEYDGVAFDMNGYISDGVIRGA